MSVIEKKLQI